MPIFFQKDIGGDTKLGIWKIEEEENFFLQSVIPQRNVSHPHKKLQHLAGRYLLKYLFPQFPVSLILVADTRKPYLEDEAFHFSISHCSRYAAAIVSPSRRVGIDIEVPSPKVHKIRNKFLNPEDPVEGIWGMDNRQWAISPASGGSRWAMGNREGGYTEEQLLTLLWSCKEAVFKWHGLGELDFRQHICVQRMRQVSDSVWETVILFQKGDPLPLTLHSYFFAGVVMSYVVT